MLGRGIVSSSSSATTSDDDENDEDDGEDYDYDGINGVKEEFLVSVPEYVKVPPDPQAAEERLNYLMADKGSLNQGNFLRKYSLTDETNQEIERPKSAVKSTRPKSARPNSVRTSASTSYGSSNDKSLQWSNWKRSSTDTVDLDNSDSDF